jgi:thioredoxin 1
MKIPDFYADWCGPCKAMAHTIESLERRYPEVKIEKIDVDKQSKKAEAYNVMSIPTYIFLNEEGEEIGREVGSKPESELEKHLK